MATTKTIKYNTKDYFYPLNFKELKEQNTYSDDFLEKYELLCWTTNEDGTGEKYEIGYGYSSENDLSLYAQWSEKIVKQIDDYSFIILKDLNELKIDIYFFYFKENANHAGNCYLMCYDKMQDSEGNTIEDISTQLTEEIVKDRTKFNYVLGERQKLQNTFNTTASSVTERILNFRYYLTTTMENVKKNTIFEFALEDGTRISLSEIEKCMKAIRGISGFEDSIYYFNFIGS